METREKEDEVNWIDRVRMKKSEKGKKARIVK